MLNASNKWLNEIATLSAWVLIKNQPETSFAVLFADIFGVSYCDVECKVLCIFKALPFIKYPLRGLPSTFTFCLLVSQQ